VVNYPAPGADLRVKRPKTNSKSWDGTHTPAPRRESWFPAMNTMVRIIGASRFKQLRHRSNYGDVLWQSCMATV